jgi:TIR domain-containing protein
MIFISYRRDDGDWPVLWLTERLSEYFGDGAVFQDRRSILPGDDFAAEIVAGAEGCSALLAVIGPRWLGHQADGNRRIDNPRDWVRVEIETAISRGIRVIPVLVHGARMPSANELPESLQSLARKEAVTLNPGSPDIRSLISALEKDI